MNGSVKPDTLIAACVIGGVASWAAALSVVVLLVVGPAPEDRTVVVFPVFAAILGTLMFLMARATSRHRDGPAALDRALETSAILWGAVLLGAALMAVVAIVLWGLSR